MSTPSTIASFLAMDFRAIETLILVMALAPALFSVLVISFFGIAIGHETKRKTQLKKANKVRSFNARRFFRLLAVFGTTSFANGFHPSINSAFHSRLILELFDGFDLSNVSKASADQHASEQFTFGIRNRSEACPWNATSIVS